MVKITLQDSKPWARRHRLSVVWVYPPLVTWTTPTNLQKTSASAYLNTVRELVKWQQLRACVAFQSTWVRIPEVTYGSQPSMTPFRGSDPISGFLMLNSEKKKKISKPHFPPTEFSRPSMLSLFFYTLTQCSCLLQLSIDCYISEHIRIFLYNSPLTPVFFPCNNHVCQPLSTEIMLTAWVEYFHQHETDWHHLPIVPQESELELSHSCILVCLELFTPYPHLSLWIYNVPFEWGLNYIHFVILHETMHTEDTL